MHLHLLQHVNRTAQLFNGHADPWELIRGCEDFIDAHGLQEDDVLIFRHVGYFKFHFFVIRNKEQLDLPEAHGDGIERQPVEDGEAIFIPAMSSINLDVGLTTLAGCRTYLVFFNYEVGEVHLIAFDKCGMEIMTDYLYDFTIEEYANADAVSSSKAGRQQSPNHHRRSTPAGTQTTAAADRHGTTAQTDFCVLCCWRVWKGPMSSCFVGDGVADDGEGEDGGCEDGLCIRAATMEVEYISLIVCFLVGFSCFVQASRNFIHANYLISVPDCCCIIWGGEFWSLGLRALYFAITLLFWFYGLIPMFGTSMAMVLLLHYLDRNTTPLHRHRSSDKGKQPLTQNAIKKPLQQRKWV
nr:ABC transporter like [Ipomoea batatas]